ncbi:MAG: hypothetical protein K9N51_09895 [Candidatus Pacebacteria bacterium]|nr:hypothetical protein [Candidatus Paceibacterota bacterium]
MRSTAATRLYRYEMLESNMAQVSRAGVVWRLLVVIIPALAVALAFVWLQSTTEKLEQRLATLRREHELREKQVGNLRIELETYKSGRYIVSAVRRFDLELRPPYPGQVRRVSMHRSSGDGESGDEVGLLARR